MRPLALCLVLCACGGTKNQDPGHIAPGGSSKLLGGVLGIKDRTTPAEMGVLNITIKGTYVQGLHEVASSVEATGQVELLSNPRPIALAGTYDGTGRLVVDGGDYTFTATTGAHAVLSGTFTYGGNEPPAVTDGSFVLIGDGSEVYCGTLDSAPLVIVASADHVEALLSRDTGLVRLSGTRTDRDFTASGSGVTLTGSADGVNATGSYTSDSGSPGSFQAGSDTCLTP